MDLKQLDNAQLMERLTIPSPCTVPWDSMHGDDRTRFCDQCALTVYNLAAMTKEEAGQLIRAKEGRLCARIFRRTDGTILTSDCSREAPRPLFNGKSYEPSARTRAARPIQFSLRMIFAFTLFCATSLGVVRIIPQSWIATAVSWFESEPPQKAQPVNLCGAPPLDDSGWEGGCVAVD